MTLAVVDSVRAVGVRGHQHAAPHAKAMDTFGITGSGDQEAMPANTVVLTAVGALATEAFRRRRRHGEPRLRHK